MARSDPFLDFPREQIFRLRRRFSVPPKDLDMGEHRGEWDNKGQGEGLCVHTQAREHTHAALQRSQWGTHTKG